MGNAGGGSASSADKARAAASFKAFAAELKQTKVQSKKAEPEGGRGRKDASSRQPAGKR